jgi:hypothetical protein
MMAADAHRTLRNHAMRGLQTWVWSFAFLLMACLFAATAAIATPLAGTVITAKAFATYVPTGSTVPETIISNTVIAIVQPVEALTLTQDNNFQRPAVSTVSFPHLLTNVGNVASTYTFTTNTTGCTTPNLGFQGTISLYLDTNGNGYRDNNDRQLTIGSSGALTLSAGQTANLLLEGQLPAVANGGKSCVNFVVTADATSAQAQNLDNVVINSNAAVVLSKSVSFTGLAIPGSTVFEIQHLGPEYWKRYGRTHTHHAGSCGDCNLCQWPAALGVLDPRQIAHRNTIRCGLVAHRRSWCTAPLQTLWRSGASLPKRASASQWTAFWI